MGALHVGEPRISFQPQQVGKNGGGHGAVVEEIHGLIRVHKNGHVERLPAIPDVPCTWGSTAAGSGVLTRDVVVDRATDVWARLYARAAPVGKVPVVVYFHGGGFCVGSAAWSCKAGCAVMSVDYRLAPENRLPASFDDGLAAVRWLRQQAGHGRNNGSSTSDEVAWWRSRCRFDRVFLMGDGAGATIAFHVAARLGQGQLGALAPLAVKGAILIQPFCHGALGEYAFGQAKTETAQSGQEDS